MFTWKPDSVSLKLPIFKVKKGVVTLKFLVAEAKFLLIMLLVFLILIKIIAHKRDFKTDILIEENKYNAINISPIKPRLFFHFFSWHDVAWKFSIYFKCPCVFKYFATNINLLQYNVIFWLLN